LKLLRWLLKFLLWVLYAYGGLVFLLMVATRYMVVGSSSWYADHVATSQLRYLLILWLPRFLASFLFIVLLFGQPAIICYAIYAFAGLQNNTAFAFIVIGKHEEK